MRECFIREYRPEDIPALTALWSRVFGDPEALAAGFLRLLPILGGGVVAQREGRVAGAAYIVTGLSLVQRDGAERRCGYLYAVAVEEESRGLGLGKALTRAAAALGKDLGAEVICTLPANAGLYPWYEKLIGTRCALYRSRTVLPSSASAELTALTPEAYGRRREELLRGRPHLRLSPAALAYEALNCQSFGGGFYAVGDGIAAVCADGGSALVREMLCPEGTKREQLAAAVGAQLGCAQTVLLSPALSGEPFIAALPGQVPEGCIWNLAFD